MEGKAILFKKYANIDAIPICLKTQDTQEIINTIINISPSFGDNTNLYLILFMQGNR